MDLLRATKFAPLNFLLSMYYSLKSDFEVSNIYTLTIKKYIQWWQLKWPGASPCEQREKCCLTKTYGTNNTKKTCTNLLQLKITHITLYIDKV